MQRCRGCSTSAIRQMDGALEMVYRDDPWIIGKHFTNADNTDFGIAGCVGDSDRNNSCFNIKTGLSL